MNMELFFVCTMFREKETYIQYHNHNYYEMVFYCEGKGTTHIGEECYSFAKNDFVLIPPYMKHDELHQKNGKVICICFYLDTELPVGFYKGNTHEHKEILNEIEREVSDQLYGYEDVLKSLLTTFLIKKVRETPKAHLLKKNDFTFIINYISDNYHEKISLKQLSDQMNISYDYFRHSFKEQTGYSPQQFLIMKRLQAATKLLCNTGLSCTEIAYQCGFSNSAQFSMLFKRNYK